MVDWLPHSVLLHYVLFLSSLFSIHTIPLSPFHILDWCMERDFFCFGYSRFVKLCPWFESSCHCAIYRDAVNVNIKLYVLSNYLPYIQFIGVIPDFIRNSNQVKIYNIHLLERLRCI